MGAWIKPFLPRSLFGRSLLIIVMPLILLQVVSTYVFYDNHWKTLSRRLSTAVAGDVGATIELIESESDPVRRAAILEVATRQFAMPMSYRADEILPNAAPPKTYEGSVATMLAPALWDQVRRPFLLDATSDEKSVFVAIQLSSAVLRVSIPQKRLFSDTTYVFILWMIGTSMILFAVASVFMRNQVRPIRRLAEAAENFGKGRDLTGFKPEGASEVRRAAIEFNRMRERITRAITQRTEMLAGVSHDLRTPLTRMKLQLAFLGEGSEIDGLRSDIAEMEKMVDGYLAFARGEGTEPVVATDLRLLLEDVIEGARREGGAVDLAIDGDIQLGLRPNAFRRGLTNLISNAVRYGRTVLVRARSVDGAIELTVDDDGPGIPREQREDAFKPFYRLDKSRNSATGGVGLGLTIARDVFRGHGGEVTLSDSPLGGLRATIRLPI